MADASRVEFVQSHIGQAERESAFLPPVPVKAALKRRALHGLFHGLDRQGPVDDPGGQFHLVHGSIAGETANEGRLLEEPIERRARADKSQVVQPGYNPARLLARSQPAPDLDLVRLE